MISQDERCFIIVNLRCNGEPAYFEVDGKNLVVMFRTGEGARINLQDHLIVKQSTRVALESWIQNFQHIDGLIWEESIP